MQKSAVLGTLLHLETSTATIIFVVVFSLRNDVKEQILTLQRCWAVGSIDVWKTVFTLEDPDLGPLMLTPTQLSWSLGQKREASAAGSVCTESSQRPHQNSRAQGSLCFLVLGIIWLYIQVT